MGVDDNAHTVAWSERQHDKGFRRLAGRATVAQKQSAVERWARARPDNRAQRGWLLAALRSGAAPEATMMRATSDGVLDLASFQLGDARAPQLAAAIAATSRMRSVRLADNRLSGAPLATVVDALARHAAGLEALDLAGNDLSVPAVGGGGGGGAAAAEPLLQQRKAPGVVALAALLPDARALIKLALGRTRLRDRDGAAILAAAAAARDGRGVGALAAPRNVLGIESARALVALLAPPVIAGAADVRALVTLDLAHNRLGDAGAHVVCDAVRRNGSLRHLELAGNGVGDRAAEAIAAALRENAACAHWGLASNLLGSRAALLLAHALAHNRAPRALDLGANPLGEAGGRALLRLLLGEASRLSLTLALRGATFEPRQPSSDGHDPDELRRAFLLHHREHVMNESQPVPASSYSLNVARAFDRALLHDLCTLASATKATLEVRCGAERRVLVATPPSAAAGDGGDGAATAAGAGAGADAGAKSARSSTAWTSTASGGSGAK